MGQRTIVHCDECGEEKKETNHWFQVVGKPGTPAFRQYSPDRDDVVLLDLCGQTCALKTFQRFLDSGDVRRFEKGK